jgi:glycogen operon protein
MLCGGDELSHAQRGNNNAYCQDNEMTWLNWELDEEQQAFLDFVRQATLLWRTQPVFQRRRFFQGRGIRGSEVKDISWFDPSGHEMSDESWNAGFVRCLGVRLAGDLIGDFDERGEPIVGETLLVLLNAHHESIAFTLPATRDEHVWERVLDTAERAAAAGRLEQGETYTLEGRSLSIFRIRMRQETDAPLTALQAETLTREDLHVPSASDHPALVTAS